MRKKAETPARRVSRRGSGNTLNSGISELLRTLSVTLGDAYADATTPADAIAHLEAAKQSLLQARTQAGAAA